LITRLFDLPVDQSRVSHHALLRLVLRRAMATGSQYFFSASLEPMPVIE
jgi:hypothetical protein